MDEVSRRAVMAAVHAARALGLDFTRNHGDEPEVLADGANVLVHLRPAPVVARVATTTALVRKPAELWLRRDLDVASFLVGQGFPAVAPSRELPAGPHLEDGFAISFWEFVEHERGYVASAEETGALLRELHGVLRGYPGKGDRGEGDGSKLDRLNPFFELSGWIDTAETMQALSKADAAMLREAHAEIAVRMDALQLPEQALHGDAHRKNLLKTAKGLLWTDFEDACRGPLAWDVACFAGAAVEGREAALRSYGRAEEMAPFFAARELQGAVWLPILGTRFRDRRARAAEALTRWRAKPESGQT